MSDSLTQTAQAKETFYCWVDRPLSEMKRFPRRPRHQHRTLEHATQEAQRLAVKLKEKVIVMKVVMEVLP